MTKDQIITAIEEGWLEQEFYAAMPTSSAGDDSIGEYVDGFISRLRSMSEEGIIDGLDEVIRDGTLTSRSLGEIRLL